MDIIYHIVFMKIDEKTPYQRLKPFERLLHNIRLQTRCKLNVSAQNVQSYFKSSFSSFLRANEFNSKFRLNINCIIVESIALNARFEISNMIEHSQEHFIHHWFSCLYFAKWEYKTFVTLIRSIMYCIHLCVDRIEFISGHSLYGNNENHFTFSQ